ncbi:MAG: transglycosylase domain-containing protein, partial [Treponema sp.]|nr:transglycosylase domain-containing protein [Treponema sp.]
GIDPISAAAAAIQNARAKTTVRGASTITKQLAKLASPGGQRSMEKKSARP